MNKRLYRSKTKRQILGICGGISDYLNADETVIRLGYAALTVITGFFPGIILYIIAGFIMPENPD